MHKRILICSLFFIFLFPAITYAAYTGTANTVYKYESTVTKCEMFNSTTNAWVTLWDNTSNTANAPKVDIGAGSVSAQMGTFMSGVSVPVGTYTQMRVTIITTVKLRGWALVSGIYYYTDVTDMIDQTGINGGVVPPDATCTEITLSPPSNIPTSFTDTVNITGGGLVVTVGGSGTLSIIFPMEQIFTVQDIGVGIMIMPRDNTPTVSPQ